MAITLTPFEYFKSPVVERYVAGLVVKGLLIHEMTDEHTMNYYCRSSYDDSIKLRIPCVNLAHAILRSLNRRKQALATGGRLFDGLTFQYCQLAFRIQTTLQL